MGIAIANEHAQLSEVVSDFLRARDARGLARAALDGDEGLPGFWKELAELGWLGLHLPEEYGGSGFGLAEAAIVAEGLGYACAPGPFLTTVAVSATLAAIANDAQRTRFLPALAAGSLTASLALRGTVHWSNTLNGVAGPAAFASVADLIAVGVGDDLILVEGSAPGVALGVRMSFDPTHPCADVSLDDVQADESAVIRGGRDIARRVLACLLAADAAGGVRACREMASEYATLRVAFGRPIGQFQAVKHHCANMFVDEQIAAGVAWDIVQKDVPGELQAALAVASALPAFVRASRLNVQVHGGIAFTWEHDAHLYVRRATALAALGGPLSQALTEIARHGDKAQSAGWEIVLPAEAEQLREQVRAFAAEYWATPQADRHRLVVQTGYLYPHWPRPWGRAAGPVEQIVVEQELAALPRYEPLGATGWIVPINMPTLITHGTDEQRERWIGPTLDGELHWCQLFSEPGAGSDLAGLATRAERVEAGWRLNGQKVWTSSAHHADLGLALVRTDPTAPKHKGITCMVVAMKAPGVTIRPLRQVTGDAEFNEVFLDDVFVPDKDVVGAVNAGWSVARTALDNERISLGELSWAVGPMWEATRAAALAVADRDPYALLGLGEVVAADLAIRCLNRKAAARAVAGNLGVEGSVTKLLAAEHAQQIAALGQRLLLEEAVYADGDAGPISLLALASLSTTIAGGSSEIMRNIIAERVLGLPRD